MTGRPPDGAAPGGAVATVLPVAVFVFLGALLSFSLEPLAGRMLLPQLGGGFHVWTTALMFFQGALVLAYLYAHLIARKIGALHVGALLLGLVALPPVLDAHGVAPEPAAVVGLLLRGVGLPFVLLSTTAVVAQGWWARSAAVRGEPYVLYAVSNAGSLGALLLYALAIEPWIGLAAQRTVFTLAYVLYVALALLAYLRLRPSARAAGVAPSGEPEADAARSASTPLAFAYWVLLSAAPSMFMMAVTNLIALDAGSVPLVWVLPLAIYLGSFMVAFATPRRAAADDREASRVPRFVRRLWPHVAAVGLFFFSGAQAGGLFDVVVQLVVLAFVTLAAHAELYRARPALHAMTAYYVAIAVGGWLGGVVVAWITPRYFPGLYEYPLALGWLGATWVAFRWRSLLPALRAMPRAAFVVTLALAVVIVVKVVLGSAGDDGKTTLVERRSLYGLYRVIETERAEGVGPAGAHRVRDLVSGGTRHGRQRVGDLTPLSYYHPQGPLGDVLALVPAPRRLAVIGLGVGAVSGYATDGDSLRFFEIDAEVVRLAYAWFTYLDGAAVTPEVRVGDARLSLDQEDQAGAARYDLILVDAFSGDAIPTHLLTEEALALYLRRLDETGLLVFHVSNRYYDLRPALATLAARLGLARMERDAVDGLALDQDPSQYLVMARTAARLEPLARRGWRAPARAPVDPWTDDRVNVLAAMAARVGD